MDESDTPLKGGTESVIPETDTSPEWDFYAPETDQDTEEDPEEGGTDDGEADEEHPDSDDAAEDSDSEEAAEPEGEPVKITAKVKLADGQVLTVGELIKGNLRQADYTRKSQELAEARNATKSDAERLARITQAFVDHLTSLVPAEPDASLALRDPNAYVAQKAQYEAAVAQIRKLSAVGDEVASVADSISGAERAAMLAEENARLSMMFPETGTKEGRDRFFSAAAKAAEAVGFGMAELGSVTDHRLFALAHWAAKGMAADKARAAVKAAATRSPQPRIAKPGQSGRKADANKAAMDRFRRTGRIEDAMMVDFD